MENRTIRLRDVAEEAGVSTFTVSQALAGKAGVSAATRARVEAVAGRLGYAVNPAASLLAMQRGRRKGMKKFLVGFPYLHLGTFEGCQAAAARIGVELRGVRPGEFRTAQEAARVLWQEGVTGLLFDVEALEQNGWNPDDFALERFALVKTTRGLPSVPCHLVRHSAFDYMTMALREVVGRGFLNIVVVMIRSVSEQDDDARLGAFRAFQERHTPPGVRLNWLEIEGESPEWIPPRTDAALKELKPDAILGYHWTMCEALRERGWRMPEKVGFAAMLTTILPTGGANSPQISGCDVQESEIYERGLNILADLMARGQRGCTQRVLEHVIEPVWLGGQTLGK